MCSVLYAVMSSASISYIKRIQINSNEFKSIMTFFKNMEKFQLNSLLYWTHNISEGLQIWNSTQFCCHILLVYLKTLLYLYLYRMLRNDFEIINRKYQHHLFLQHEKPWFRFNLHTISYIFHQRDGWNGMNWITTLWNRTVHRSKYASSEL